MKTVINRGIQGVRADVNDPKQVLAELQTAWHEFKKANDEDRNRLDSLETLIARSQFPYGGGSPVPTKNASEQNAPFSVVTKNGTKIPLLRNSAKLSDFYKQGEDDWSMTNFVRSSMGLEKPKATVTTGPATVPTWVGSQIIDAVRAKSRVVQAGAGTIPIENPTNLARITADPTVYQHAEGVVDILESDIVLAPVALNPKYLVAAVPLSAEIVEDSPNLNHALTLSLAAAFASKLDSLCLATILADATIPTSSVGQDPATWAGVLAAVAEALAADQDLPGAFIGSEADFIARASELAVGGGSWLGKPPALNEMRELFTSSVAAGLGIFGDFLAGLGIAVRQDLRLDVQRQL